MFRVQEEHEFFIGSGNVFADLGLPDAEELQLKSHLGIEIRLAIQAKRLSRSRAAQKMGLGKEELIGLLDGSIFDFSISQLVRFLNSLDREVRLSTSARERPAAAKKPAREQDREATAA